MAVELKKFQAELTALETAATSAYGERKTIGDSEGNFKKLIDASKLAIGDRVGKLRAEGKPQGKTKGFTIDDFLFDAEVKKYLDAAKGALTNYKTMEARKITNLTQLKSIYAKYVDLSKRIDAEVADRKKKLFEPKSLPDMIKLGEKVKKEVDEEGGLKTESLKDIAAAATPKVGAQDAAFAAGLQLEINKGAAVRENAAVSDLLAKFQPRLLKLRWDKANGLVTKIEAACKLATDAKAKKDTATAKTQLKAAEDMVLELSKIDQDYSEAYNKNKSFLQGNPDHDTVFKVVSGLTSLNNKALKSVAAAQKIVG